MVCLEQVFSYFFSYFKHNAVTLTLKRLLSFDIFLLFFQAAIEPDLNNLGTTYRPKISPYASFRICLFVCLFCFDFCFDFCLVFCFVCLLFKVVCLSAGLFYFNLIYLFIYLFIF